MAGFIYGLFDVKDDSLFYIGATKNVKVRVHGHRNCLKNKKRSVELYRYILDNHVEFYPKVLYRSGCAQPMYGTSSYMTAIETKVIHKLRRAGVNLKNGLTRIDQPNKKQDNIANTIISML